MILPGIYTVVYGVNEALSEFYQGLSWLHEALHKVAGIKPALPKIRNIPLLFSVLKEMQDLYHQQ